MIRFDISAIPSGSLVTEARLYVYQENNPSNEFVNVHPVVGSWSEAAVTWNTSPAFDSAIASFASTGGGGCMRAAYLPVALVQAWVDDPATNYGVMLIATGVNGEIRFSSREDANASLRPRLAVDYVTPTATPTATSTPTWTLSPTPTLTFTPSSTPTHTQTPTPTDTPIVTPTEASTPTPTPTPLDTPTPTPTPTSAGTPTPTDTITPTPTPTSSDTPTPTPTPTSGDTPTPTPSDTPTPTPPPTYTPSPTATV